MKKIVIALFILTIFVIVNNNKKIIIPDDAIRFRIIANSNEFKDIETKSLIKSDVEPILFDILNASNNKLETVSNIKKNVPKLEEQIEKYNVSYNINYGLNYFPEKTYKNVTYKEGNYESLVITLGDGLGDNWWCVLFPPLCLLEAKEEDLDEYTYSLYAKEIIDKYF